LARVNTHIIDLTNLHWQNSQTDSDMKSKMCGIILKGDIVCSSLTSLHNFPKFYWNVWDRLWTKYHLRGRDWRAWYGQVSNYPHSSWGCPSVTMATAVPAVGGGRWFVSRMQLSLSPPWIYISSNKSQTLNKK